jgi:large subunit ribosomal protein L5
MQKPHIEKVVFNIGVGESGEKLVKAEKLLSKLTGRKPVRTMSKHKIPAWGLRKGEPIGCMVTFRGKAAEEMLKKSFEAVENTISPKMFDKYGNFGVGVREYIDFPGMKYDPEIGIFGFTVTATMKRPGGRISKRKNKPARVPEKSRLAKTDSIDFIKEKFGVKVE